jgi:hypothetical protein
MALDLKKLTPDELNSIPEKDLDALISGDISKVS